MKTITTILCLFMLHQSHAQISGMNNWKTQMDLRFFSTLQYPPDWVVEDISEDGYIIRSPAESDTDHYRENIALFAMEVPDSAMVPGVKNFAEMSYIQNKEIVKDIRLMVHKDVVMNGIPMYLLVYNGVVNGQYLYFKQLYCLYKNGAFVLTYTGQAGKEDRFKIVSGDMLNSFRPNNVMRN